MAMGLNYASSFLEEGSVTDTGGSLDVDVKDKDQNIFDIIKEGNKRLGELDLPFNLTGPLKPIEDIPLDADFIWLLITLLLGMIWAIYATYFHSRVTGFILTQVMNRVFLRRWHSGEKCSWFHCGSFSISFISGKIMFRDLIYITHDYSLKIQDGWLVFRWWVPYVPKDVTKQDLSVCETRLLCLLNGFELHVYNRCRLYASLEKVFNLPSKILPNDAKYPGNKGDDPENPESLLIKDQASNDKSDIEARKNPKNLTSFKWFDLIPVSEIEISSGRFMFGNQFLPSTLSINFDEGNIIYTAKPAASSLDLFTYIAKAKAAGFKVVLLPSARYLGLAEEPPRFMGEGFVVCQSRLVDFYYYEDEPGIAGNGPEKITLPSGEIVDKYTYPSWGVDIKCGKGTDLRYGPWADRQREFLYNFFYPADYKTQDVTAYPKPGELRIFRSFELKVNTMFGLSIDLLFTKDKETKAVHIHGGPGSYVDISVPYVTKELGYTTHISGQILNMDATTSLHYRSLAKSETFEFDVKFKYPRVWNHPQERICSFAACKATVHILYVHKTFFYELIDDWAGKARPDVLTFVPYTWKISVIVKDFEVITLANEYNLTDDPSVTTKENNQLSICGEFYDMSLELPLIEFLPNKITLKLWMQGEGLTGALYVPEVNPTSDIIHMLCSFAKITGKEAKTEKEVEIFSLENKWRRAVKAESGWTDFWSVPVAGLNITYTYWPIYTTNIDLREHELTTPEKEEALLAPMRPSVDRVMNRIGEPRKDLMRANMEPEVWNIELEIGASIMCIFRPLLRFLCNVTTHEANVAYSASVDLPLIRVSAEYIEEPQDINKVNPDQPPVPVQPGHYVRKVCYLNAIVDLGAFEHSLTTDILSHLLLLQKLCMKQFSEVVHRMSVASATQAKRGSTTTEISQQEGGRDSRSGFKYKNLFLFTSNFRIRGIQITATTPTQSAVRLETGIMELLVSNKSQSGAELAKVLMKLQVDLHVALGQLIKNPLFEEAESEFQQLAYFKTRISLKNTHQDAESVQYDTNQETIFIILRRPLLYIQPLALDKAVLIWLNYKNAYEYWNEQLINIDPDGSTEPKDFGPKSAQQSVPPLSAPALGSIHVQLTVDDLGVCLPISSPSTTQGPKQFYDTDLKAAVVVTLESTEISASSSGTLVSKAKFTGLCFRFVDDFETSLDDWKPDPTSDVMNLCVVSEGTYEIYSRTKISQGSMDAKWILNVGWRMEGFDIHVDTSIGKHFSALFKTLTALAGDEDDLEKEEDQEKSESDNKTPGSSAGTDNRKLPPLRSDSLDDDLLTNPKKRSRLIEKELNEQAKIVNDLRQLGAREKTIEQEVRRLHELEAALFNDFRRDVIKKFRKPSIRNSFRSISIDEDARAKTERISFNEAKLPSLSEGGDQSTDIMSTSAPDEELKIIANLESPTSEVSVPLTIESQSSSSESSLGGDDIIRHSIKVPQLRTSVDHHQHQRQPSGTYDGSRASSGPDRIKAPPPAEPYIDFELDVQIFFDSGKCVLHTRDPQKEEEIRKTGSLPKDRSFSGTPYDVLFSSPGHTLKHNRPGFQKNLSGGSLRTNISSSKMKYTLPAGQYSDMTIFLIPGLDVKFHYNSKTVFSDPSLPLSSSGKLLAETDWTKKADDSSISGPKKSGLKKASLFAWMTLHSIPQETVITPHLLDFLEQALEPIPIPVPPTKPPSPSHQQPPDPVDLMASAPAQYAVYASFPVDVVVYFHVQPSVLRFSCLPASRVECILQLPSVDLVFSSKQAESDSLKPPQNFFPSKSTDDERESIEQLIQSTSVGGICMNGRLSDFSLFIFHPYGEQRKTSNTLNIPNNAPLDEGNVSGSSRPSSVTSISSVSSNTHTGRKDSLSLQVELVKMSMTRNRETIEKNGMVMNSVKFVIMCDASSASFKYDMRRLTEILAFPKAWYRKAIWKRMFLGDPNAISSFFSDVDEVTEDSMSESSSEDNTWSSSQREPEVSLDSNMNANPLKPKERDGLWLDFEKPELRRKSHSSASYVAKPEVTATSCAPSSWETHATITLNLGRLNIHMNMGNVMGNTNWTTRGFRSEAHVFLDSFRHKRFSVNLGLEGSSLDAKGGIVAGVMDLNQIKTGLDVKEDFGKEPCHVVKLQLHAFEKRLDYMGTSILLVRISDLELTVRDEWRVESLNHLHPTKRPALIFLHGKATWDQFQMLMSKSTTPDIMKMVKKVEQFFTQQFHSSKKVFYSLEGKNVAKGTTPKEKGQLKRTPTLSSGKPGIALPTLGGSRKMLGSMFSLEAQHHRHWQKVLKLISGAKLSILPNQLPKQGTIVGGTVELNGNQTSLACFYGVNFRCKSWATFSLQHATISFSTEAQDIIEEGGSVGDTHIIQHLCLSLGREVTRRERRAMATVCRISRKVAYPPQFKHLHEWFSYAFATGDIDQISRFPIIENTLDVENQNLPTSASPTSASNHRISMSPKTGDFQHHHQEVIFSLPSFQMELKTEHLQSATTPPLEQPKPCVDCTFVTEFDDHIFVAVDAEAYYFLHELITSYIKEKEVSLYGKGQAQSETDVHQPPSRKSRVSDYEISEMKDWREFVCQTWHLEPTVRLLSWAGKNIEPYGVDYILQRLGFSQARTTIPKWIQRGAMDPLDNIVSNVIYIIISAIKNTEAVTKR